MQPQIEEQKGNLMSKCCEVVYFKHDMGWDCYDKTECYKFQGAWLPRWFDNPVVEDAPTKKDATQQIKDLHILGVCLVRS